MDQFKDFVQLQVQQARRRLEELLLLDAEERTQDTVPAIHLRDLRDDSSNRQAEWSFLNLPENKRHLPGGPNWLLNWVLHHNALRERFCDAGGSGPPVWKTAAVKAYSDLVDAFLERLLLVIHVTCGQPARGTKSSSLSATVTADGDRSEIFSSRTVL